MTLKSANAFFLRLLASAAVVLQTLAPAHAGDKDRDYDYDGSRGPSGKFTIAVIPDTQYLFDEDRGNRAVVEKSLQWIVEHSREKNIVFTVHLGDIVNNGGSARWGNTELAQASDVFKIFDRSDIQYGVVAGNHDIPGGWDDQRGHTTYLDYFGPSRTASNRSYCGSSDDGYNNCYTFSGGNQRFLLLALDWRASDATIAWAKSKLQQFSGVPTIIATHEILTSSNGQTVNDAAVLSGYGQTLWDRLIKANSQIFMTLNGHNWPAGAVTMKDLADREVYMHLVNYQDRYFSGSGMIRLYEFDLRANTVDVQTFSPYWLAHKGTLPPLAKDEVRLEDSANKFTMEIDFKERFAAERPVKPTPPVSPDRLLIDGTMAYWRFEGQNGSPLPEGAVVARDLSGRGNDLTRVTLRNGTASDLTWTSEFHPQQPSRGSLFVNGSKNNPSFGGAYLRTVDGAPINGMTFKNGYTIEAFVKLPEYCCEDRHAWMGVLSRMGRGGDLGRTEDDPDEPLATLTVSPSREFQWAVATFTDPGLLTNWSFRVPTLNWYHVALVNDGKQTLMYINGSLDQRNPQRIGNGLLTTGEYWMIGANHYGRTVEHSFYGWIGDVRIVNRPLQAREFMLGDKRR
ncbi:LamG-like jellyroll fold domain-containing protein [Steroidobacter flavus]|uniref:LamG-like jellyroll fold domain-containing protein n=1 Tax=Steroidobacter flavus TaxID=1842136 RepID=A0ABV8T3J5_9GAMM